MCLSLAARETRRKDSAGWEILAVLGTLAVCLAALLIVRAFIYSRLGYTPLPFGESAYYHFLTICALGLAGALAGLLVREWRGMVYSSLAPFLAYLAWAVVQQNLIVNPDLWKLWERGWLTVALAAGLSGFVLSAFVRLLIGAYYKLGDKEFNKQ